MARVDAVATFLHKLYDVKSVFRLHNFGNFLGVVEVESNSSIFGHHLSSAHKSGFAAAYSLGSLGIQQCQGGEIALAAVHAVGIVA